MNNSNSFVNFIGIVEDIDDPLQLGRVRVRVFNHHNEDVSVEQLDWATCTLPTTSASKKGIGSSPTWIEVGSLVVGWYLDGEQRTMPLVIATIPTIPNNDKALHSVHPRARGEGGEQSPALGPEPAREFKGTYPNNKTISTPGGHLIEIDDTAGEERLSIQHKSGSYVEINSEGRIVLKSVNDQYEIVDGNKTDFASKDISTEAKGKISIKAKGKVTIAADGNCSITSKGTVNIKGSRVNIQ
jgi:hypothetical protein